MGVRTALHQMVNFRRFYSELALGLIHPDSGKKQPDLPDARHCTSALNSTSFLHDGDKAVLTVPQQMALPELLDRLLSLAGYHYQRKQKIVKVSFNK